MLSPIATRGRLVPIWLIGLSLVVAGCAPAAPGTSAGSTSLTPAAAAPKATTPAASASTSVVLADFAEPALLNPALSTESPRVSHLIFDSLVQADPKTGVATGSLAEKWEQSADGLTYTFHRGQVSNGPTVNR